ncbi:hypothetical protein FRC14_005647 [Serendipita sp. 396]|nr:hypothetical protein FRC14_005647 [Serendipita sp. 396]KAG8780180.1 hypothetical protein FRC15_009700 [Serendipita sp. 397]KAG8797442.1 hypothetical protein FRC16_008863 [Serendipita sp. 398]KAG8850039.1 hypothetical protein FRB91_009403 [Serendipita sp. 411]KAG8865724.1 hypothetical protein FRC20_009555 [Serendipita sp. 405]
MNWEHPGLTPWTKHLAVISEGNFLAEHRKGSFPLINQVILPGEILRIFIRYILHLKQVRAENPESKLRRKRQARRRERRRQKLEWRKKVVSQYDLPSAALDVLELLGSRGMSSEESEEDIYSKSRHYHIKTLPWRASSLTEWLRGIDYLSTAKPRNSVGRFPRRPHRSPISLVSEYHQPPTGLPPSFYSSVWLKAQSPKAISALKLSKNIIVPPKFPKSSMAPPSALLCPKALP